MFLYMLVQSTVILGTRPPVDSVSVVICERGDTLTGGRGSTGRQEGEDTSKQFEWATRESHQGPWWDR